MESLWLALGGLIGAAIQVATDPEPTWSRQSLKNVLTGGVVGFLYNLYPVVDLPAGATLAQKAAIIGVVSYVGADFLPNLLGQLGKLKAAPRLALVLPLALLGYGCAGPLGSAGNADQLKELIKVKDANITCIIANTPYGKGSALFLNLDKAVIQAGAITVSDSCNTTITLEPKPKP